MLCSVKPEGPFVGVLVLLVCVGVCWCVGEYLERDLRRRQQSSSVDTGVNGFFFCIFFFFLSNQREKKRKKKRENEKRKKKRRGFSYLFLLIYVFLRGSFLLRRENKINNYRKNRQAGRQAGTGWLAIGR